MQHIVGQASYRVTWGMGQESSECWCVPGEVCCQRATDVSRKMRDLFPGALMDGDWTEFDELRAWLKEHHFGGSEVRDSTMYKIA